MARCPYLEYLSGTGGPFSECEYQHMYASDSKLKYTCDAEYGDNYKNCPVYKNS